MLWVEGRLWVMKDEDGAKQYGSTSCSRDPCGCSKGSASSVQFLPSSLSLTVMVDMRVVESLHICSSFDSAVGKIIKHGVASKTSSSTQRQAHANSAKRLVHIRQYKTHCNDKIPHEREKA